MVVITAADRDVILDAVRAMYTAVATRPDETFHFPTGRRACLFVGYAAAELDRLPATAVESFAGVGYPFAGDGIRQGDTVLDIGCGSGTDALLAALEVGGEGRVIGLDMTDAMLEFARQNQQKAGVTNVEFLKGEIETVPLPDPTGSEPNRRALPACPQCGACALVKVEGCNNCLDCGYSKCG